MKNSNNEDGWELPNDYTGIDIRGYNNNSLLF